MLGLILVSLAQVQKYIWSPCIMYSIAEIKETTGPKLTDKARMLEQDVW